MTHIMIEDNTPEGKWLLELIRGHKSVTVMDEKKEGVPGSRGRMQWPSCR